MGKLTLLLVGAAVIGGSLLTFSTRQLAGETQAGQRAAQADLLSRQIAESGHAVVLAAIVDDTGFRTPSIRPREYEGGTYRVSYDPSSSASRATFTVRGDYAGASHTIRSTYDWDPMDYPSPVWLDVPYATALASNGSSIDGGIQMDRRKHDAMGLQSLVPMGTMNSNLRTAATTAGTSYSNPSSGSWNSILEDLNVSDGEGLYQTALALPPETTIAGPTIITNNQTGVGAPDEVTHVTGDLTVSKRFEGEGVLVVDGTLTVTPNGRMEWTGIVIVRAERQYLPVELKGRVDITGGLVIVQHAYPPGGHMDVTTWRDLTTGIRSGNVQGDAPIAPWTAGFPWLQHKHRFDEDLGTRRVRYLEGGNAVASQETWTQFEDTISRLGTDKVYLEFENESRHGYGVYTVGVRGMAEPLRGMVRDGFGSYARGNVHQSQSFRASDLEDFEVDIRSLRTLRDRFDGNGCDSWPFCLGERLDRGGALRVRLRSHTTNRVLYESALYWHMQPDEWTVYQEQEAEWRSQIQNGAMFGTRLEMGPNVDIEFDIRPVLALVERMGFDGNEVIHLGTETEHFNYDQNFANSLLGGDEVRMCHKPTGTANDKDVPFEDVTSHIGHGDVFGNCDGTFPTPVTPVSPSLISICHKPGTGQQEQMSLLPAVIGLHIGHGDTLGACPDDDDD